MSDALPSNRCLRRSCIDADMVRLVTSGYTRSAAFIWQADATIDCIYSVCKVDEQEVAAKEAKKRDAVFYG